jgi:hypothetical protein
MALRHKAATTNLLVLVCGHHLYFVPQPLLCSCFVFPDPLLLRLLHGEHDLQLEELLLLPLLRRDFGRDAVEDALLFLLQSLLALGPGTISRRDRLLVPE